MAVAWTSTLLVGLELARQWIEEPVAPEKVAQLARQWFENHFRRD